MCLERTVSREELDKRLRTGATSWNAPGYLCLSVTASDPEGLQSVIVLLHCILPNLVKFQFHHLYPEPGASLLTQW